MICIWRLLDRNNTILYRNVKRSVNLSVKECQEGTYGVFTQGKTAIIYVPKGIYSPPSFTHELLHIELKNQDCSISTKCSVSERPRLKNIFSEMLSDHITNVLEHRKMFPKFISMGYDERDFLSDSSKRILTQDVVETIIASIDTNITAGAIQFGQALGLFIGEYLSARCSCFSFYDYSSELQKMRNYLPGLTSIMETLVNRWDNYDYTKHDIILDDTPFDIANDFLDQIEDWLIKTYPFRFIDTSG